jgi:hypothetical protein
MSLDYSDPIVKSPPPTEDLIPEAKLRARRRHWIQAVSGLLVVAVAATTSFLVLEKPGKTASSTGTVPPPPLGPPPSRRVTVRISRALLVRHICTGPIPQPSASH